MDDLTGCSLAAERQTMEIPHHTEALLPDLPSEEPWYELKFQLRELWRGIESNLERLRTAKSQIGSKAVARDLALALGKIYDDLDHDAQAHAPRAVQVAEHLLASPSEPVPEWDFGYGCDNRIPPEILACKSIEVAQVQMARHMEETLSALSLARQALLRAVELRGPVHSVLEHVLQNVTLCMQLLKGLAWEHARDARRWSRPYWYLVDPESAAAEQARIAAAEAEQAAIEAELDAREAQTEG